MFGHGFFGAGYYGPGYWGPGAATSVGLPPRLGKRKRQSQQDETDMLVILEAIAPFLAGD